MSNLSQPKTVAKIHAQALLNNLKVITEQAPEAELMAMVKGDAYGHGMLPVAQVLAPFVQGFGVTRIEEAVLLKDYFPDKEIVLLQGLFDARTIATIDRLGISWVVHHPEQIDLVQATSKVWYKFETGMHRLGLPLDCLDKIQHPSIRIMSHFACADEPQGQDFQAQLLSMQTLKRLAEIKAQGFSFCNSAGIFSADALHCEWVRPGIALYGGSPLANQKASDLGLKPVMSLESQVFSVRKLDVGESVGYGATFQASQKTNIAVVACGYADGYPRHISKQACVYLNNKTYPIVGRVSMDMLTIDLGEDEAHLGDSVEMWGANISVDQVAAWADTIAYEVLSQVTPRVARQWID